VGEAKDLGNVALLPGLINAHTHLEFGTLAQPLGGPGLPFTSWIRQVIAWRRAQAQGGVDPRPAAIHAGISESANAGCRTLGEIATLSWLGSQVYQLLRGTVFLELLGMGRDRERELLTAAQQFLAEARQQSWPFQVGLSPHAPYTISRSLLTEIVRLSAEARRPIAMHLAETREELELLAGGGGPFRELLVDVGAWHPEAFGGATPLDYLKLLGRSQRSLVIHGNYLSDEEIAFLAAHGDRMSVVYCPRTHNFFGHTAYPLAKMLAAGARVVLGTDSRASNPDLNLLRELRFAAQQHPDVSPARLVQLCTRDAAEALGIGGDAGSLDVGMPAEVTVVPLNEAAYSDPWEALLQSPHEAWPLRDR